MYTCFNNVLQFVRQHMELTFNTDCSHCNVEHTTK